MLYFAAHKIELVAALAGLINIFLAARNSIWNWLFGIITVSLYLIVFYHAKLYADMCLQFLFLLMQFYGIYQWRYGGDKKSERHISHAPVRVYFLALINTCILFCIIAHSLHHYTDSSTVYIDAVTAALSLVAQWMMSRKWIEHWLIWLLVNSISVDMYFDKGLYFTAALYGIFIVLCCMGFRFWQKNLLISHSIKKNIFVASTPP